MSLDIATRDETVEFGRVCPCHDPDGTRSRRVRRVPFYGAVTLAWVDAVTGHRRPCAPVTTESNG